MTPRRRAVVLLALLVVSMCIAVGWSWREIYGIGFVAEKRVMVRLSPSSRELMVTRGSLLLTWEERGLIRDEGQSV